VDYPDKVLSLVIISAGPLEITDATTQLTKEDQHAIDTTSKMFISRKDGATLDETIQSYLPIWRHCNADIPFDEEMAKEFTRDFLIRTKNKNTGQNHELMMSEFLATMKQLNGLKKINRPTLVIYGDKDPVVPPRCEKSVADAIPKAKLVMIKGMGHTIFNRELEEKIAELVVEHIKPKD
jgi:esterase